MSPSGKGVIHSSSTGAGGHDLAPPSNFGIGETMENQHRKISGYRELSEEEIAAMNRVKQLASEVGELCLQMREKFRKMPESDITDCGEKTEALRWLDAGELQMQQAFMAITRSIARPTTF